MSTATKYDRIRSGHMFNKRFEIVKNLIQNIKQKVKTIGEMGCGTGRLSYYLSKEFKSLKIEASDVSKTFIQFAIKNYESKNLKFFVLNIEDLNIKEKYDVVVTIDVIHHLRNKEKGIINVDRALTANGYWMSLEPNIYNPYIFLSHLLRKNESLLSQEEFEKIFSRYFQIMEKSYATLIPSFITNPPHRLKFIENELERFPLFGGCVIYLLKKRPRPLMID